MSHKTLEEITTHEEPAGRPDSTKALDAWLRRELESLYDETADKELPPGIADLAKRLEAKLRSANGADGDIDSNEENSVEAVPCRDRAVGRTSPDTGRKR